MAYIESYFDGELSPENKIAFEKRIETEPDFAADVAFYLSSKKAAAEEMQLQRENFRQVYARFKQQGSGNGHQSQQGMVRKLWPWVAAAAILAGIIFGLNIFFNHTSPQELADNYVKSKFETLAVTMGNTQDSLQSGLRMFNEGKMEAALVIFETLARNDGGFSEAKKFAGIVSLRLNQYDKAIDYFSALEKASLYANPGKFYHALTLMKRNRPGDQQAAKDLLEQVIEQDLEGKETASEWFKKW